MTNFRCIYKLYAVFCTDKESGKKFAMSICQDVFFCLQAKGKETKALWAG